MSTARDQQIQALYEAALERPPGERTSFVAALTGEDKDLRQSVELLLSKQDATDVGRTAAPEEDVLELPGGTRIGQYRIDGVLGRGGMGVVYRATDTKLNRPVAIKFLASAVADPEVRRRFAQEAETTSALNHPHIVTTYDVGEHDGAQYIVSELVDGGTLDDSIASTRKRSWRQSVELLTGVADALAAAHAAGVLHRDVKPSNILIGSNGYAKLGDFGLAKLVGDRLRTGTSGARSVRHTRAGLVVGTVAYMSPEQASGQPLDARSDVFSFGVVLYELLAGKRPFEGANDLETLKAVAHAAPEPPPDDLPELLRMVLDKALEKEPADRYQTMQDLVADLKRVTRKQATSQTTVATNASRRGVRLPWVVASALGVALVVAIASLVASRLRPPPAPAAEVRFQIPVPDYASNGLAVSPDGAMLAHAAVTDGVRRIWIRPLGGLAARPVPGTEGAQGVFWSPDSRRLAFFADGKLRTTGNAGEAPAVVTDVSPAVWLRGVWLGDGTMLLTTQGPRGDLGIGRVAAGGGTPATVALPDTTQASFSLVLPVTLPDGEHILYASGFEGGPIGIPTARELDVRLGSLATPDSAPLLKIGRRDDAVGYVPGLVYAEGFLVFLRESTLLAQRFDADALELRGDAIPIADDVAEFSVAANVLVYRTFGPGAADEGRRTRRLVWFDRNGQRLDEVDTPPVYRLPALSPDGRQISLSLALGGPPDVWTIDTQRGTTTRLTFDPGFDDITVWSPDSTRIAFNSSRDSGGLPSSIYERAANGTGADTRLFAAPAGELIVPFDWSSDGRWLVFGRSAAAWQSRFDLWVLELTGERTAAPLIESAFVKAQARFSPDARWIAYLSNESNGNQIVVQPFPDLTRGRWQVSTRGGQEPRWSPDGRELFYMDPDGVLMAVDVSTDGDALEPGLPRPLFRTNVTLPGPNDAPEWLYAVAPDGERFLINEPVTAASSAEADAAAASATPMLNVIVNWTTTLRP